MKTYTKTLMMALMAMLAFSVTSCDDDDEIAYTLEGTWEGNMYASAEYDGRVYDASRTEVCFVGDPYRYSSGTGYWVDYYRDYYWGDYNYLASHIEWEVRNRTIYIYFVEDHQTVEIYDYSLSDNYFTGYIYFGNARHRFSLRHVSSPNWNDYYYSGYRDYGYGYYDYYEYSNSAKMDDTTGDVKDSVSSGKVENGGKTNMPARIFRERE